MSDYPSPFSEPSLPPEEREERAQRRAQRTEYRRDRRARGGGWSTGTWIGGAVLILLGIIFLLDNLGIEIALLQNWWAFFILIPAVGSFSRAVDDYRQHGRFTGAAVGALMGGFVLTMVALVFLLGLGWSLMLPIILILAGLSIAVTTIAVNR